MSSRKKTSTYINFKPGGTEAQFEASLLQATLESTLESTTDGILVVNREGKIVTYNQKFKKMWRIPLRVLKKHNDDEAVHSVLHQLKDPEGFLARLEDLYTNVKENCLDEIEFADGRVFERYTIPQYLHDEIIGRVFSFRDVTKRKQMEEQLKRQATFDALTGLSDNEDRTDPNIKGAKRQGTKIGILSKPGESEAQLEASLLQATLESTADGILVVNREGKIVTYNQKFRKMWRIPPGVLKRNNDDEAVHHVLRQLKDAEGFVAKLMELYTNPEMDCFDEIEFADGRIFERYSIPQYLHNEIIGRVFSFRDVTRRKQMEEQLMRQATFDALTGLPNRVLLEDRIDQNIKSARRRGTKVGILFFDLDRFKIVNDSLGHNMGDALLKAVADRLGRSIREGDTLSRWGGDEFVIVLPDLRYEEDVIPIITNCQSALEEIFIIDNRSLSITSSVGGSFYPKDGNTSTVLLKNADAAMYNAKSDGRNNYRFYRPQMNERAIELLSLESDLHKALERNEFILYYQPLVDLRTGQVKSAEALLRWIHPTRGFISPLEFIELAEETGLIQPIGEWVLNTACMQNKAWQDCGLSPIKVAVNVSGVQFKQRNIVQIVEKALLKSGLDPQYLDLELTESSIMENTHTFLASMSAIKDLGVGLVIDDFGTGYSSLGYLKRFPVNKIKIDKSFVHDVTKDDDDDAIVQAIIAMAQKLKLLVVAEGVETLEQVVFLQAHKCDEMQGYFYSPPVPADKYEEILRNQHTLNIIQQIEEKKSSLTKNHHNEEK